MCFGFIYDTIINPLPLKHRLQGKIHFPSLLRCAEELSICFHRAIDNFDNNPLFFINSVEEYEDDYDLILYGEKLVFDEDSKDNIAWKKFLKYYPKGADEIKYAIQIAVDNFICRNNPCAESIITDFFTKILRNLLCVIPSMHKNHVEKRNIEKSRSLGPVPFNKLADLRKKAGLPIYYVAHKRQKLDH